MGPESTHRPSPAQDEPAVFSLDGVTVAVQLSSLAPQLGGAASWTVARLGEASKTVLALQAIDTEVGEEA